MRPWLTLLGCAFVTAHALIARADQPYDFMFERQPAGSMLMLDYFGTGAQLTLEQRTPIYGFANELNVGASSMLTYPMGQLAAHAALRLLFLELGGQIGYRALWRNLSFEPGADGEYCAGCDRASRRALDPILGDGPSTDRFMFAEARAQLYAPLNDYVVFTSLVAARYEDVEPRSFDWVYTTVHDAGVIGRSESLLFFKHRDWGGFGPYLQLMFLPRAGKHETEVAFGFNAARRLGLLRKNDLLFLTFLIRPGDRYYGQHTYYSPVRALLIYRMILAL